MIRLTDEAIVAEASKDSSYCQLSVDMGHWGAKTQLRMVVEWGSEDCDCGAEHKFDIERSVHRHFCPSCWQVLLKEL